MSKKRNIYRIPFVGLKEGVNLFDFKITEKFFETAEEIAFEKADIDVEIEFNKKSSHFELKFNIQGYLFTTCDRCLAQYPQELLDEFKVFIKLSDREDEESEDPNVIFIDRQETHLDLKQLIYEFIQLSIPLQRICNPEPGKTKYCDTTVLEYIKKENQSSKEDNDIDPRWAALKNIKK